MITEITSERSNNNSFVIPSNTIKRYKIKRFRSGSFIRIG